MSLRWKLTLIFIVSLFACIAYFTTTPRYSFQYYYSADSAMVLTRVDRKIVLTLSDDVYFTPGYYKQNSIPDIYVKPIGYFGKWMQRAYVHSNGIFMTGNLAETKKLSASFVFTENSVTNYREALEMEGLIRTFQHSRDYIFIEDGSTPF